MVAAEVCSADLPAPLIEVDAVFHGLAGISRVAVAVSGGSDSMALLRLAHEWAKPGTSILALTVDHGLRDASADDAAQVAAWCAALGIFHNTLRWSGLKPVTGIQAKARKARYDLMSAWCHDHAVGVLLTGHTLNDQAETVMMRQHRTNSSKSLASIWPENQWQGIRLVRPLLGIERVTLQKHLRALGQRWLDDPSNDDPRFERVRVRLAMPANAVVDLASVAGQAQERVRAASLALRRWISLHAGISTYGVVELDRLALACAEISLQRDVLAWAVAVAGGGPDGLVVESVAGLTDWATAKPAGRRTLGGALVALRKSQILVVREAGRVDPAWKAVGTDGSLLWDKRFCVKALSGAYVGPMGSPPRLARPEDCPDYVHGGLPVVKLPNGNLVSAVEAGNLEVSAQLCERFLL